MFECKQRAARVAQNPTTMERVSVPSKRTVKFKVGRLMKVKMQEIAAVHAAAAGDGRAAGADVEGVSRGVAGLSVERGGGEGGMLAGGGKERGLDVIFRVWAGCGGNFSLYFPISPFFSPGVARARRDS